MLRRGPSAVKVLYMSPSAVTPQRPSTRYVYPRLQQHQTGTIPPSPIILDHDSDHCAQPPPSPPFPNPTQNGNHTHPPSHELARPPGVYHPPSRSYRFLSRSASSSSSSSSYLPSWENRDHAGGLLQRKPSIAQRGAEPCRVSFGALAGGIYDGRSELERSGFFHHGVGLGRRSGEGVVGL